jgi:AraC-like DNA-binding protein
MPINDLKRIHLGIFDEKGFRISPSREVESIIEGIYVFSKDSKVDSHLIYNDGFPVLIFLGGEDESVTVVKEREVFDIKAAWASGGSIKKVYVRYTEKTEQIFVVRFMPSAFYQLFNLDTQHFRYHSVVPFEPIAIHNGFCTKAFFECGGIDQKVAFIETYVEQSLIRIHTPEVLQRILAYIHQLKGKSTVLRAANDAGVSYKWLERSFAQHIGLLPKEYIQLQRFMHAYLELVGHNKVDLMQIAISNGYYDSNHFLKDFKAYTGKTPREYLKFG